TITLLTAQLPQILNASTIVGAGTRGTLTITGPGATTLTISGNNGVSDRNFHILSIDTGGNLAISGVTFSGAKTTGAGGAIENAGTLTVSGSTITGNSANDGGGITNWGTLTVINTTISGNTSITQAGGGIQNSSGSLTVTNSTISGNTAATQAGGIQNNGILVVSNSTISGNTALTQSGGGIYNFTTGTLTLSGTTIAGNSANDGGGIRNLGALNISNTIIANSTSGGDYAGFGSISTNSNNLVEDGTLPGTSEITGDPNLGPLQNNGGPTFTMALLSGSAAIGAGNATISNAAPILGLDQRGINRTTSDIGAYSFGIQVTNTSDSNTVGSGSLRAAINLANTTAGDDQIVFNLTGTSPYTITLGSALPTIVSASTVVGSGTAGTVTITGLGASALTISGSDPTNANNLTRNFSIFSIASGGDLSISGVTISGAKTSVRGGAFNNSGNLAVSNSTISGNTAGTGGGGIFNFGTLNIANSTISGNTSNSGGGGIVNNSGTFSISNSTISGNTTSTGAGGGINNNNGGNLNIANSTISGNTASTNGGGIFNNSVTTVINSTISGNTAGTGGGINNNSGGTLNIANSIIANSITGGDYAGGGTIGTNSNNLVEDGTLPGTSEITGDPNLGPLQNNGGTTFTMALGTGSVAIGAGDATISNARPINGKDQRGYARSSTAPSIGAFEYILATQATLTTPAAGSASGSAFTTQPIITIKDTFGNTVNTNVSVTMTVSSGATTLGTTTINAVAGIATFTNVGISGIDGTPYTLTFTSTGLTIATQTITITTTFGTATQVILTTPALGSASGSAFTTQPVITIKDAAGNIVTNSTASVTMTVSSGATTVGTTTINAVAGIATFTNVGISGIAGTPYTLTFTSTGLTSATQSITPTFGTAT
ncbi:MAG: beta strand repeat-containing protein, partial [Gemmataceae bacterium]